MSGTRLVRAISGESFLEDAFVRWVLTPAVTEGILPHIVGQQPVAIDDRNYVLDFVIAGSGRPIVIELDGFEFHSSRKAFVHDRSRQNDLVALAYIVLRFSYDAIRDDTARCVSQLQSVLAADPQLAVHLIADPIVPVPDDMDANPLWLATPPPVQTPPSLSYFDEVRQRFAMTPLRGCQREALTALADYYRRGGTNAACVMSVGSGKTVLGVAAALAFSRRRALIVTPGRVIRGAFATALDESSAANVIYTLRGGPLIPGCRPPRTTVLDRQDGPIRDVSRETLLSSDIIVTNFHSLNSTRDGEGLLGVLDPDDIDFIVVDEAHIAAATSYQNLFDHFPSARRLLMSACFSRADGKSITADVVYRYRLIDSIADGHAKHLRAHRFSPEVEQTEYEITWPDGTREEIVGKQALLEVMDDERKLARITATSEQPIHRIMQIVSECLDSQKVALAPLRPRVLFAALGQNHAEQIARIANAHGIIARTLHHSMSDTEIAATRRRYEAESGTLQAVVQLKMLGQGYDLPAISVVVPMRPYGSFGEFYQFIGRGIRMIHDPDLAAREQEQHLDVVYHGELGLDTHLESLRIENDMDPNPETDDAFGDAPVPDRTAAEHGPDGGDRSGSRPRRTGGLPAAVPPHP
ncbi:superfamily II DNA or RNA helicase [Kribbella rubisoli]|uniref:Superfamily II DNA or RNA helicase n=1 Tax=Kribbella rubisoli TaxID=3075929 RepID=A0A4Q7WKB2_9ACTN|nr:DEAD/DEAH box helicase family protein [Kribbella rubisoli]RZU10153.1 superfamily II DNA or RNA helicase [Kribbella rubisoli]